MTCSSCLLLATDTRGLAFYTLNCFFYILVYIQDSEILATLGLIRGIAFGFDTYIVGIMPLDLVSYFFKILACDLGTWLSLRCKDRFCFGMSFDTALTLALIAKAGAMFDRLPLTYLTCPYLGPSYDFDSSWSLL